MDFVLNNASSDLTFSNGEILLTPNIQESAKQRTIITLRTFAGEWFFNRSFGVPYIDINGDGVAILGKSSKSFADINIKSAILTVDEVEEITSFESTLDPRTGSYQLSFTARVASGEYFDVNDFILTV